MPPRAFLVALTISSLLLVHAALASASTVPKVRGNPDLDEDDLSFLEEEEEGEKPPHAVDFYPEDDGAFGGLDGRAHDANPVFDETDVVVLGDGNFSEFMGKQRHVLVEFYVPWCGHCKALAPEYAAAATALRGEDVVLAKVDATKANVLAQKYDLQGYPTVLFFSDGVHKDYPGQRNRDAIIAWIKKKIGLGVQTITTAEEAEKILTSESRLVLGFLDSLVGADSQELSAASKLEDNIDFYQTVNPDVARLLHIDANAKRPSLVLLKEEEDKISYYDGQFSKAAIVDFVIANKLPLVTVLSKETGQDLFDNPVKRQLLLFAMSNDAKIIMPAFQEAAKLFKGKLIFVYVAMDNEDIGTLILDYFGVTEDGPKVLAYTGHEDAKKFILDGEVTLDNIKKFAEDFLEGKLKPFYKSDPIPDTNDGDVKIVVGINFEEIVLDESKDVLLEIYAPWCEHCRELEPAFNKLAKLLRGVESLVIAKMEGTRNEHPRAKADGFPTLLFYPAGNKSCDPMLVDTDGTLKALYKFIKKHSKIPFEIKRPVSVSEESASSEGEKSAGTGVKEEL
ncbi:Thioredoxin [Musa troglodytarum]|uniref:Protein disulfide isomerase-like 1-4 n=1 Tax=Musa troglodytarum TaxID=320322 RepID=A0A9E7FCN5_9LILI|nr:Thioredoxin [Musa troglodytarum]